MEVEVLLKLGNLYLERKAWEEAKLVFLRICKQTKLAVAWHGLGVAYLFLEELSNAEQALNQANLLNDENCYTWGALALLCLKSTEGTPGRYFEFKQTIRRALDLGLGDPQLLTAIGHEYVRKVYLHGTTEVSKFDHSEALVCYKLAFSSLKEKDSVLEEVKEEFDKLKAKNNNHLDKDTLSRIEASKESVVSALSRD